MRLLDRYILKEMASVFLIALMVFTFVFLTNTILRRVEFIVNKGVDFLTVLKLFLYVLPASLVVTIPFSVLLATLATFMRLNSDGEMLALRGAGLSLKRLTRPALFFGLGATVLTMIVSVWILPSSTQAFKSLLFEIARQQVAVALQEGIFNSAPGGLTLYVEHLNSKTSEMAGVFLVDGRNSAEQRVVIAKSGRFTSDPKQLRMGLTLREGSIHLSDAEHPDRYRLLTFQDYSLVLDEDRFLSSDPTQRPLGEQELPFGELRRRAEGLRAQGQNYHPLIVELHRRLAIPFSCALFALVGIPLASRIKRGGRGLSLAISAGFGLGYYVLIIAGEGLGARGTVPEALAMWLPNLLIAAGGCLMLARAEAFPAAPLQAWRAVRSSRLGSPGG
jgi:lipopolysaccharide export system permease protein